MCVCVCVFYVGVFLKLKKGGGVRVCVCLSSCDVFSSYLFAADDRGQLHRGRHLGEEGVVHLLTITWHGMGRWVGW